MQLLEYVKLLMIINIVHSVRVIIFRNAIVSLFQDKM